MYKIKKSILTSIIVISSLYLVAQSEDSGLVYSSSIDPGTVAVIIGFAAFYFIIKPLYNSISNKTASNKDKPMVNLCVSELPLVVYTQPSDKSEVLTVLQIGDTLYGDANYRHKLFYKVLLRTGQAGFINKSCKLKRVTT